MQGSAEAGKGQASHSSKHDFEKLSWLGRLSPAWLLYRLPRMLVTQLLSTFHFMGSRKPKLKMQGGEARFWQRAA